MKGAIKSSCWAFGPLAVLAVTTSALSVEITLTPGDINGLDTNTTSFSTGSGIGSPGDLTLTPLIGNTPATFNDNATRLGIDDQGTNAAAFNDPDTDPNNGNEEKLRFEFGSAGLTQIDFDFARADGGTADDGLTITGFLADPGVTVSVPEFTPVFDALSGDLFLELPVGISFVSPDVSIFFGNPSASEGQTLELRVTDTDQAGAQFPITLIAYEDSPSSLGDVDGDGDVDFVETDMDMISDFDIIRDNFYNTGVTPSQGDLNGDGTVTIADFNIWNAAFSGGAISPALLFVPEPASMTFLVVGCIMLSTSRGRR